MPKTRPMTTKDIAVSILEPDGKITPAFFTLDGEILSVHNLGYAYFFGERAQQELRAHGAIYYQDSISPIDEPTKPIVKRYIKVRRNHAP